MFANRMVNERREGERREGEEGGKGKEKREKGGRWGKSDLSGKRKEV